MLGVCTIFVIVIGVVGATGDWHPGEKANHQKTADQD
jgi:hypothetical protein